MMPSLIAHSQKGIDVYDVALVVNSPIENVMASFKGMGISMMTLAVCKYCIMLHYYEYSKIMPGHSEVCLKLDILWNTSSTSLIPVSFNVNIR